MDASQAHLLIEKMSPTSDSKHLGFLLVEEICQKLDEFWYRKMLHIVLHKSATDEQFTIYVLRCHEQCCWSNSGLKHGEPFKKQHCRIKAYNSKISCQVDIQSDFQFFPRLCHVHWSAFKHSPRC